MTFMVYIPWWVIAGGVGFILGAIAALIYVTGAVEALIRRTFGW